MDMSPVTGRVDKNRVESVEESNGTHVETFCVRAVLAGSTCWAFPI